MANRYRIFLSPPHQSGEELEHLKLVLESNWLAPGGAHVEQFESELCKITEREHCVALNSGTAAIHLALKALGVGVGDFVLCQTFSFVATANPIAYLGAYPVFVDSEPETWNIDPELLKEAIEDLRHYGIFPKAILYAHIYGNPAKVYELERISAEYQIPLVEDAAEALGATIDSTSVGKFGKISILSFNGNKVVTTSGGGALLTDDQGISRRTLLLSSQARMHLQPHSHHEVGYNYRMSNLCAALGLAQIKHLEEWIERKKEVFRVYKQINLFEGIKEQVNVASNFWLSVFLLKSKKVRDELMEVLEKEGIESRRFWKPLHQLNIYDGQKTYISGVANDLFERGICLPSGVGLSKTEQKEILKLIETVL